MGNLPRTVFQMVNNMKDLYGDSIAVRYYDEDERTVHSVSYAQCAEDICRCAGFLKKEIPGKRPHVAILAKNSYYFLVHLLAVIMADMVVVPLNLQKSPEEECYETEFADVTAIIHDGTYLEREPEFAQRCHAAFIDINAFSAAPFLDPVETEDPDALAVIQFTSGTTANSKGVMMSQNNFFATNDENVSYQRYVESVLGISGRRMSAFVVLPLFHVAALFLAITVLSCGQSINLCNDPRRLYRDIAAMPSDFSTLVPVLLKGIHDDVMRGKNRFGTLKAINAVGAAIDPQLIESMREKGFYIFQGYGMTETAGTATFNTSQDNRYNSSIGKPINGVECKLEEGELCIRGKGVMMGYYKDPAATAEIIDPEGWLHTGDLARIDDEGYIYLIGRKKNLIILSSGENINPEELENLLYKNPDIIEAVAVEQNGKICARIYCPENARESVQNYVDNLNRTLPMYKHISAVEFRSEPFERTATGKIKRT